MRRRPWNAPARCPGLCREPVFVWATHTVWCQDILYTSVLTGTRIFRVRRFPQMIPIMTLTPRTGLRITTKASHLPRLIFRRADEISV